MKKFIITSKTLNFPNNGIYKKYELQDSDTYNTYKLFHFVTKSGEVGILDCHNQIPAGVVGITKVFDKLIKEKNTIKFHKIAGLRQDAWRYFADKSANNDIWHMYKMTGSPYKNNLTDEEIYSIKLIEKKEVTVESQDVTYKKWLSLSEEEQLKHMRLFLDNPVEGSDYIFNNTFHENV